MSARRYIPAVAVLLSLLVPLACFGAPVTITYWQHSSAARDTMMKALAYEFMQDNPDIRIKMEFIPEDSYSTKLIPALSTKAAPDVMQVQSGMIPRLVAAE